jgi:hypothetical protein
VNGQACENCRFWVQDRCRRYPPNPGQAQPVSGRLDWCGEWQAKPLEPKPGPKTYVVNADNLGRTGRFYVLSAGSLIEAARSFMDANPQWRIEEIYPKDRPAKNVCSCSSRGRKSCTCAEVFGGE